MSNSLYPNMGPVCLSLSGSIVFHGGGGGGGAILFTKVRISIKLYNYPSPQPVKIVQTQRQPVAFCRLNR